MEFEDDVFTLISYSLITTNVNSNEFENHRRVQFSTRRRLELNSEPEQWKNKYLHKNIIRVLSERRLQFLDYLSSTLSACGSNFGISAGGEKVSSIWSEVLDTTGLYAVTQGNYLMAEEMIRQALEGREKALEKEHLDTLTSINYLAGVLRYQGKYETAKEMNRRALEGREKAPGKEHLDTLTSVNDLAGVLERQGKYETGEKMNGQTLDGYEKALGKAHPSTLTTVSNLAAVLTHQGKYEAAEEMIRRALEGREKALGKERPDTLVSINNLAAVLRYQEKYEAAEEISDEY